MTRVSNYGSIHISDNRDLRRDEREKIRDTEYVRMSEEDPYQELLPEQESWTIRHKQFIGKMNRMQIDVKEQLENRSIFRNKSCSCIRRNLHCQQLLYKSV